MNSKTVKREVQFCKKNRTENNQFLKSPIQTKIVRALEVSTALGD